MKIIEDNQDKSDELFKSTIIVAKSKSDKLNKKWNKDTKKGISAKDMCERQFLMYLNKK